VDAGAGIMDENSLATGDGFHGGPDLGILTRAADIRRATKADPRNMVDDNSTGNAGDIRHAGLAVDWLNNHDPNTNEPWMLWVGLMDPHPPFDTNSTYLAKVNTSAIQIPTWQTREEMHPFDTYMSQSKNVWGAYTDAEIVKIKSSYYGVCVMADELLGQVLDTAQATGHMKNTVIIYTSDHGEMGMEHRQGGSHQIATKPDKHSYFHLCCRLQELVDGTIHSYSAYYCRARRWYSPGGENTVFYVACSSRAHQAKLHCRSS
jgi:hypothetical protein